MYVVECMCCVVYCCFQCVEFFVVVFVVVWYVDYWYCWVECFGGLVQVFCVVVDVVGQYDEICIGVWDCVGQVVFEVQVGQDVDFYGFGFGVGGFSVGFCWDLLGCVG